ncbi:MAG TPA: tRNA dihydrouridine synthase DusB, partial [Balneola sp.]|nr:tRNA dihydrouridine synthase DusB [Balneola sp.]
PIIGNGDVTSPELAKKMFDETGVDGVMIGRGAIGNPWIFEQSRHYLETGELLPEPSLEEKLNVCAEQLRLSVAHQGEKYGVVIMKKHYGQYLKGIYNGKKLRMELMKHDTMDPILEILLNFKEEDAFALA